MRKASKVALSSVIVILSCLLAILSWDTIIAPTKVSQGTLHHRSYFYVGQSYTNQDNSTNSTVTHGQIYVEHLVPTKIKRQYPLLFIPGNGESFVLSDGQPLTFNIGMTGTNFLNTPDGRPGWADYFLGKGYEVYIIDPPCRGRSPWQKDIDGEQSTFNAANIESRFTATPRYNLWPQASLLTQWPGNGSVGDPFFDAFYASTVPSLTSYTEACIMMKTAGTQLLNRIGKPVVLVTHSMAGQFGWILADAVPKKVASIIAIEPMGPPFTNAIFHPIRAARPYGLTEIPLAFSPPIASPANLQPVATFSGPNFTCYQQSAPSRKLMNLANIPVLLLTSESGYHAIYDGCTAKFLRQAGVHVKHIFLPDVGIHGNGHMMFMEMNRLEIAERVVEKWLSGKIMIYRKFLNY